MPKSKEEFFCSINFCTQVLISLWKAWEKGK